MTTYHKIYSPARPGVAQRTRLPDVVQGSQDTLFLQWVNLDGTVFDLTGATLTGSFYLVGDTGTAYASDGTLTLTSAANGQFTWQLGAGDTGTAGNWLFFIKAVIGGDPIIAGPIQLTVVENPDAADVAASPLVGVSTAEAAYLAALIASIPDAADVESTTGAQAKADAAEAAAIAASVPKDGAILSKSAAYQLAAGDEAKIIECDGTFTVTLPDGLDAGFQVVIVNVGSGTITLAAATTLQSKDAATQLASQYGAATVYHRGGNVWAAFGDLS